MILKCSITKVYEYFNFTLTITISITYTCKYIINFATNYMWTECGKCYKKDLKGVMKIASFLFGGYEILYYLCNEAQRTF